MGKLAAVAASPGNNLARNAPFRANKQDLWKREILMEIDARYCGAFCQHKDWEDHARVCR